MLRVGYNRVFGYYIEVSKGQTSQVPETYIRKQTLTTGERYITPELKELERTILTAKDRITALEYELFSQVRQHLADQSARIQRTARAVAALDVLTNFAALAARQNYCRPEIDLSGELHITDGRHPVVEQVLKDALFVPNDTALDCGANRVAILTGPNMAGKSTYMRQVALIVLMAQMGCFVPARTARIGVVDRIFTRIGASDDLASGQSTFMVEMTEVAEILKHATSLIVISFRNSFQRENNFLCLSDIRKDNGLFSKAFLLEFTIIQITYFFVENRICMDSFCCINVIVFIGFFRNIKTNDRFISCYLAIIDRYCRRDGGRSCDRFVIDRSNIEE